MKRREMKLLLEERFERIALLETRIDTMDQLVEGYRTREQAILDTLQSAKERTASMMDQANAEAAKLLASAKAEAERMLLATKAELEQIRIKAQAEADQTRAAAKAEADALLADANSVTGGIRADAERQTAELVAIAKADSDRMLRDVEIIKREYEEMVESFNSMLAQNASELEVTAARFADFVKDRKIDPPEIKIDGDAFYKSVGVLNDAALPDASEDPATLMQNIYRIQNRPLPEEVLEGFSAEKPQSGSAAVKPVSAYETRGADGSQTPDTAPYSEAAWVNESRESESEPQAEFTKAFENAFAKSDYVARPDSCQLTQTDVEQEFDSLFAASAFPLDGSAATAPAAAAVNVAPQPEASRVFDELFGAQAGQGAKTAQDEAAPVRAETPEITKPEPYSEAAWAKDTFTSDHEPQSEGALFSGESETRSAEAAQDSVASDDANRTIDDYFASYSAFAPIPAAAPEPYSEAAWAKDAFTSALEPQAEGELFTGEPEREPAPAQQESPLDQDAARAFDSYFSTIGSENIADAQPAAPEPAVTPEPEPYSGVAWTQDAFVSDHVPQAEGAPVTATTERETANVPQENSLDQDAARAFDSYFSTIGGGETAIPQESVVAKEPLAAPEPYSGAAWTQSSFVSDHEPQAEGALFAEKAEEELPPAPRRYNEYGEVREWEPEPEPEMEEIPTVSRYMGQSGEDGEISLDALLDEIIKAGE